MLQLQKHCLYIFFSVLHVSLMAFKARILGHMAQMLAWELDWLVKNFYYSKKKTPLIIKETRTYILSDSTAIATSALNHCTT